MSKKVDKILEIIRLDKVRDLIDEVKEQLQTKMYDDEEKMKSLNDLQNLIKERQKHLGDIEG